MKESFLSGSIPALRRLISQIRGYLQGYPKAPRILYLESLPHGTRIRLLEERMKKVESQCTASIDPKNQETSKTQPEE